MGGKQILGGALMGLGQGAVQGVKVYQDVQASQQRAQYLDLQKKQLDEQIKNAQMNLGLKRLDMASKMAPSLRKQYVKTQQFQTDFQNSFGFAPSEGATGLFQDQEIAKLHTELYAKVNELRGKGVPVNKMLPYLQQIGKAYNDVDAVALDQSYKSAMAEATNMEKDYLDMEGKKQQTATSKSQEALNYANALKASREPQRMSPFASKKQQTEADLYSKRIAGLPDIDNQLNALDDAMGFLSDYSRSSLTGGTGPIATLKSRASFGILSGPKTQTLEAKFRAINLKNMVETFKGMSRAIDSEADRRAWEATQPSLKLDDKVNVDIILGAKSMAMKAKQEMEDQRDWVERYGDLNGYRSRIVGNATTMLDKSGNMVLVSKENVPQMQKQGYYGLDEYIRKGLWEKYNPQGQSESANAQKQPPANPSQAQNPGMIQQNGKNYGKVIQNGKVYQWNGGQYVEVK